MLARAFGECREGQIPRSLLRCKFDTPSACCGVFDFSGGYTAEQTIRYLDIAHLSEQVVLKTEKAISQLEFLKSEWLNNKEVSQVRALARIERKNSLINLDKMIKTDKFKNNEHEIIKLNGEEVENDEEKER